MSKTLWAKILAMFGAVLLVYGITGQFGLWWGMIAAGTLCVVASLTMIDVDEPTKEDRT